MDTTIAENIAFGEKLESIDLERVKEAAYKAQISNTIESWPNGYETMVGERGIKLSGGQRQRIAIARALYKHTDLIVFDEATSALDEETEELLMNAIESLSADLTILIIAHRISTLRGCDLIIELGGGEIKKVGTYQDLIVQSK
jgi:ATP-binding cassette subfamily B protein